RANRDLHSFPTRRSSDLVAQIDWHPDEQTESIGTLLLHLDAIEWSYLHQDISGLPDEAYPGSWAEALPIRRKVPQVSGRPLADRDRKSTRLNSSHSQISY